MEWITGEHAATMTVGSEAVLHGSRTLVIKNGAGRRPSLTPSLPVLIIRV